MCGFTGFFDPSFSSQADAYANLITRMSDTINYRGPDDSGTWMDDSKGIVLGFRRLSILDLIPSGHQPMVSANGRYVIVFNGEIYNFAELQRDLVALGNVFRGTSDTEVMLAAITQWGIKTALTRFNGMFAFAMWDRLENSLTLARDRLGIKPLYYGWVNRVFFFGSELKSFRPHPAFRMEINRDALCLFFRHNYIPSPHSIYQNVYKLKPGSYLTVLPGSMNQELVPQPYWSLRKVVEAGNENPFAGDAFEAVDELENLIKESIHLRMIADVPVGAFLSGGVDSSTVVAIMQSQNSKPVKTFTIGFNEQGWDEAAYARKVAAHLKTDHTELYVTPEKAMGVIPILPFLYDEPFSDASQIPTYLVSQLARQNVTVSLSGDGGDELFGGYERYFRLNRLMKYARLPSGFPANLSSRLMKAVISDRFEWLWKLGKRNLTGINSQQIRDRISTLAELIESDTPDRTYLNMQSHWKNPNQLVLGGEEPSTVLLDRTNWPVFKNFTETMMYLDMETYLPDDILAKVDRASMGVSLEARVPLLDDHRLVEFAWRLPISLKIREGKSKWLLRQVLYRHVPPELIERPKMGFGVPVGTWIRGPLRNWAEDLLDERLIRQQGFLNPAPIREKWQDHLKGLNNWQFYLWDVLMFQSWLGSQNA